MAKSTGCFGISPRIEGLGTIISNVPLVSNMLHRQEHKVSSIVSFRIGRRSEGKFLFIPMRHFCVSELCNNKIYMARKVLCFHLDTQKGGIELSSCFAWSIGWFSQTLNALREEGLPQNIRTSVDKNGRTRVVANQLSWYGSVLDKIPYSITKDGFFKIDKPFILDFKIIQGYVVAYDEIGEMEKWNVLVDENGNAKFQAANAITGEVSLNVPDSLVLAAMDHVYQYDPRIDEVLDEKWAKIIKEKRDKELAERLLREQAERERRIREEQAREEAKRIAEEQERLRLIKVREEEEQRRMQEQQMQEMLQGSILFVDTETTGTPRNYKAPISDLYNWPRLVQLAWIMADKDGNVLKKKSAIIKPIGFSIPSDASAIHGITTERALREGKPLQEVLEEFATDLSFASQVVGHNIDFDQHIVGAELYRLNMDYSSLMHKNSICTMKSSVNFCAIPNPNSYYGGYKWPSLSELYRKLFGRSFEDAHDALADITATKECYFELKRRGVI